MSYSPLHHKYRPRTFAELVGQEAIATTLTNGITLGKIAPAYLFTGPRGTGKTSSARILAKSLNCLNSPQPTPDPCGECEACVAIARGSALDVIEIDAASNTGVDNIREIIERSQFAPVQCRYKVYVIDECHMLSTAAFNALLKTLEEPPPQIIFILATTDPQRVLPTIISRCQRFDYRRIPLEAMVKHLEYIATEEQIKINLAGITLIAQLANGGLRDAQSLLDQLSLLDGEITPERIWDLVGATSEQDLIALLQAISEAQPVKIIEKCRNILNRGREPLIILQNLASFYLNLLIAKTSPQNQVLVTVTSPTWQKLCQLAQNWTVADILKGEQHLKQSEVQIKNTTQPHLWLEITLLGLIPQTQAEITHTPPVVNPPTPTKSNKSNQIDSIYTDGSCLGNPGPGGWAYVVYAGDKIIKEGGGHESQTTNQRMELAAALGALEYLEKNNHTAEITLYTDSQYVIKGLTQWLKGWKKNGWITSSKTPVVNQDLWKPLDLLNSKLKINWQHVRGHQGNEGNERADALARSYASQKKSQEEEIPNSVVEYQSPQEIWQQVITLVQPVTTRALFQQQARLIEFDGAIARVGISTEKLLKLHQGKIANLEAAFFTLFQRKVKVVMEVISTPSEKKNNPLPSLPPPTVIETPKIEPTTVTEAVVDNSTPPEKQLEKAVENILKQFQGEIIPD